MKTKTLAIITAFILQSCSGGGSKSDSNNPLVGLWAQKFATSSQNVFVIIKESTFTFQQGTCSLTGDYSIDQNYIYISHIKKNSSCVITGFELDCIYNMPNDDYLVLTCDGFAANLSRQ